MIMNPKSARELRRGLLSFGQCLRTLVGCSVGPLEARRSGIIVLSRIYFAPARPGGAVYFLVSRSPLPLIFWNHGIRATPLPRSLRNKVLYAKYSGQRR